MGRAPPGRFTPVLAGYARNPSGAAPLARPAMGFARAQPILRATSSKVAPPPLAPPLLERGKPAAERVERKHDQQPRGVYAREGQSEPGGLLPRGRAEQPAG